jgi:hypothetical protein
MEVPLTQGYVALVDAEDYQRVMQFKWYAHVHHRKDGSISAVYAQRMLPETPGKRPMEHMHRFILNITDPSIQVDHKDHDGLNDRKSNLRAATKNQNQHNVPIRRDNTSGFKGVCWHKQHRKWVTTIQVNNKPLHIGLFLDLVEAAHAYDAAAIKYHGKFACLNFPEGG